MVKVKTFTNELRPFFTMRELDALDEAVNRFVEQNGVKRVLSVGDACTTDETGATIGIIRVIAYEA
jgi:hypothetical protein